MQTAFTQTAFATLSETMAAPDTNGDVTLAASGDRRAFERLYRANVNRVYAICMRMCGDQAAAEELTQDAFVRTWERLPQFRGDSAFSTWLHRLTVNVVLEARRSDRRRRAQIQDQVDPDEAPVTSRLTSVERMDAERMDIATAIAALPKGARTVFALHDVEGFKHEEIARMLDITSGGSKAQLHRARRLLREALT